MKKRVLFVDDETKVLQGLKRMLRTMRKEWEMDFATSGELALSKMEEQPFDVVVSDMRMPGMDGAELLTHVMNRFPNAVRIVLSGQADKEAMLRSIGPSHQYLSKPCDAEMLKQIVGRACGLRDILTSDRLSFISQMEGLPSLPEIYTELVEELKSDEPSIAFVTRLIEKDVGMTAKILQLVNSAYFGVRKHVSSTAMAIKLLGLENVRSLVLFANVFSQVSMSHAVEGFSPETLWKHSGAVGQLCQEILRSEKKEKEMIDNALTAGLLHDCGKLVFAANIGKDFGDAMRMARKEEIPLSQAEEETIGASHADAGAYLLGLWGLPDAIIEAVAFHHAPSKCFDSELSALTAVHVADALMREYADSPDHAGPTDLDPNYISTIGVDDKIESWRKLAEKKAS